MTVRTKKEFVVRTATNRDRERVTTLVYGVLAEYGLPPDPCSKDSDLDDLERNYIRPGGVFELIEDKQGNLLGTYGLYRLDQDTCELRKMYFVPEIRGQGLGRQTLERCIDHARRLGYRCIVLETFSVLKEAIRLYTRFGFVLTETKRLSARVDQTYILKLTDYD